MKQYLLRLALLSVLVAAAFGASAQQIAVVTGGNTTMHQTLAEAIGAASHGSVIYLPGGGFSISDDVKIDKKLTIIGIGYKADSENVDGNTVINGNLIFLKGSDGSAVMGCYISGYIGIGKAGSDDKVNDITIKYCNLYYFFVPSSGFNNIIINQNLIRNKSDFKGNNVIFTNNVAQAVVGISGGTIANNILTIETSGGWNYGYGACISDCSYCNIKDNILKNIYNISSSFFSGNIILGGTSGMSSDQIDLNVILSGVGFNDLFVNDQGCSPVSNFHFKDEYKEYESQVGIYAGTGFSDGALPPTPYIVAKKIADQTDAEGKLSVKLRVNAGE